MIDLEVYPRTNSREQSTVVFLSLFLIVLAFFILLNSISKIEETRAALALKSLTATFAPLGIEAPPGEWLNSIEGRFIGPEEMPDRLATLIKTAFPLAKVDKVLPGSRLQMSLATESLFEPGRDALRSEALVLVSDIARMLTRNPPDYVYGVEAVVGESEPVGGAAVQTLAIARAGALARTFVDKGAPASEIAAGTDRAQPERTRFVFRIRLPGERRVDFHQLVQ